MAATTALRPAGEVVAIVLDPTSYKFKKRPIIDRHAIVDGCGRTVDHDCPTKQPYVCA